ncbi:MAG: helix-turn-helix domain-containing protein [Treponema sp.]|jgi:transcriptional regulator with XRE-family HTH domain|nr:helix-turn-helix domain-containing protein [Treponema sp.]
MALSDRIRTIILESELRQKAFAKSISVTDSYISKLLRDESGMSNSTAMLIEQLYGYSKDWILTGRKPKMIAGRGHNLTSLQRKIIVEVKEMNEDELRVLHYFIEPLNVFHRLLAHQ